MSENVDSSNANAARPAVSVTPRDAVTPAKGSLKARPVSQSASSHKSSRQTLPLASSKCRRDLRFSTLDKEYRNKSDSHIRVSVRVRPFTAEAPRCVSVSGNSVSLGERTYTFHRVFDEACDNAQVVDSVVPLAERVTQGYNATVIAYGQTGSGKTHTVTALMDGSMSFFLAEYERRANKDNFCIFVSFVEIYNEQVFDLLSEEKESLRKEIKESTDRGFFVADVTVQPIKSMDQFQKVVAYGVASRTTAPTKKNDQSSRSHAILSITIYQKDPTFGEHNLCGKLNLVDLAGSETLDDVKSTQQRETCSINKSLFMLNCCLNALSEGNSIPNYRASALTKILKESLGGNSMTTIIGCIDPRQVNAAASKKTLTYVENAKKIQNKPVVNEDPQAKMFKDLQNALLNEQQRREQAEAERRSIEERYQKIVNQLDELASYKTKDILVLTPQPQPSHSRHISISPAFKEQGPKFQLIASNIKSLYEALNYERQQHQQELAEYKQMLEQERKKAEQLARDVAQKMEEEYQQKLASGDGSDTDDTVVEAGDNSDNGDDVLDSVDDEADTVTLSPSQRAAMAATAAAAAAAGPFHGAMFVTHPRSQPESRPARRNTFAATSSSVPLGSPLPPFAVTGPLESVGVGAGTLPTLQESDQEDGGPDRTNGSAASSAFAGSAVVQATLASPIDALAMALATWQGDSKAAQLDQEENEAFFLMAVEKMFGSVPVPQPEVTTMTAGPEPGGGGGSSASASGNGGSIGASQAGRRQVQFRKNKAIIRQDSSKDKHTNEFNLCTAAEFGDAKGIEYFIKKKNVNPNCHAGDNWRPLHFACRKGHVGAATVLLEAGADINARTKNNWTPLMMACDKGYIDVIRLLVSKHADIRASASDGTTALALAHNFVRSRQAFAEAAVTGDRPGVTVVRRARSLHGNRPDACIVL